MFMNVHEASQSQNRKTAKILQPHHFFRKRVKNSCNGVISYGRRVNPIISCEDRFKYVHGGRVVHEKRNLTVQLENEEMEGLLCLEAELPAS